MASFKITIIGAGLAGSVLARSLLDTDAGGNSDLILPYRVEGAMKFHASISDSGDWVCDGSKSGTIQPASRWVVEEPNGTNEGNIVQVLGVKVVESRVN